MAIFWKILEEKRDFFELNPLILVRIFFKNIYFKKNGGTRMTKKNQSQRDMICYNKSKMMVMRNRKLLFEVTEGN